MSGFSQTSVVSDLRGVRLQPDPGPRPDRAVKILDLIMAGLFAFAAALQFNDPDPIQWIAIYTAAAVLSVAMAARRRVPRALTVVVAVVAIAWAAFIALGGPASSEYRRMFDAWEMKSPSVEEAREASGLVIVAAWMTVLFIRSRASVSA